MFVCKVYETSGLECGLTLDMILNICLIFSFKYAERWLHLLDNLIN